MSDYIHYNQYHFMYQQLKYWPNLPTILEHYVDSFLFK